MTADRYSVADIADRRLDDYRNLRDVDLRHRLEAAEGIFIVEGSLAIRQLLASRYPVRSLLLTAARLAELAPALAAAAQPPPPVYLADTATMERITGFAFHRGALASAARLRQSEVDQLLAPPARLVAVIEDVNDHENLGALWRNAAAFGVDAVLLSPGCADPLYRRSVRVSMGHVLRVPWARLSPWPGGLDELKAAGFLLVALTPDPGSPPLERVVSGPKIAGRVVSGRKIAGRVVSGRKIAVLLGAEGPGLSPAALARADERARIPMAPGVDSLNVATAAAIAFHHLANLG